MRLVDKKPTFFNIDAAEFVPKSKTWAEIASSNVPPQVEMSVEDAESELCPFSVNGSCRFGDGQCAYVHGQVCDLCFVAALHPTHEAQRRQHRRRCLEEHEKDMEEAFALAKSKEKTCGICMEIVLDKKEKSEARFGILPNCNHCFCLSCLRTWRQANFENKIIRACPECRQTSDYICPSKFWVDTKEEKEKLLADYKVALNNKECKYFNKGEGECPFGNKCFYRHRDARGKEVDVGPPTGRGRRRQNADGELTFEERILIQEFLGEREGRMFLPLEYLELFDLLSDSDSEIEFATY